MQTSDQTEQMQSDQAALQASFAVLGTALLSVCKSVNANC